MVVVFSFLLVTLNVVFIIINWWSSLWSCFCFLCGWYWSWSCSFVFYWWSSSWLWFFLFVSIQTLVLNPYISLFSYVIILPCHVGHYHDLASYFLLCILNLPTLTPFMYWSSNWRCCKRVAMHPLGCCQAIVCCIAILWAFIV